MDRNWLEDFDDENGKYQNTCIECQATFVGHKRRVVCKICVTSADQSRVIAVLTEALVKAQEHLKTHQHPFETAEYQHAIDMYREIEVALAEAKRIQEGKRWHD